MPLTRYQIRDEFRLADPELYRAADKDDPEALLEGVAMAGLVGVLRQLGDLAEFASEIFHNLHEEVMVTAARGHGMTLRVQQLEVEFLSIEKAFLSQTCHSPFLHNSGVDWHPNLRLDQSLITEGDLPRFVMDSYEDCRGPPRLFLLDKFDIAGAGACLKRYTDPSFFRAEFSVSEAAKEELMREKKARKVKKKGSRWRAGENPELTASHSKLHQLLLEERCQSQIDVQKHRVKLKRRHSSNSVIHSTSIKNYMEKLLNSHSPDRKLAYGSSSIPSRFNIGSSDTSGLVSEHQTQGRSPPDKQVTGDRNPTQSHGRVEKLLKPLVAEFNDVIEERNSNKMVGPAPETNFDGIPSSFYKGEDKKQTMQIACTRASGRLPTSDLPQSSHLCELQALGWEKKTKIVVNGKGNIEAEGYHSDDANSEIENYTDALTTMDSEVETDTDSKPKNEGSFKTERKYLVSETVEVQKDPRAPFSESHAKGDAVASEDKNHLLETERLGSYRSDTVSNSSESLPSGGDLVVKLPATISESADISSRRTSGIRSHPVTRSPEHAVSSESFNEASGVPSNSSSVREASGSSSITNLASVFSTLSPEASVSEVQLFHPNSVMIPSNIMDSVAGQLSPKIENVESAGHDMSCMTNVSDIPSQSRHDFHTTGPQNDQTLGLPDGRDDDASNDIPSHLFDILGAPHGVKVVKDVEEQSSIGIADDSHAYQMSGKFDSPDSVLLNTETEVYSLGEQYQEAGASQTPEGRFYHSTDGGVRDLRPERTVVGSEEVMSSGKASEFLTLDVACHGTHEIVKKNDPKIRDEALSLESDMAGVCTGDSEMEALYNSLESNVSDRCVSEMGASCNNVEFDMSYNEVKNGHTPQTAQFNSITERSSGISPDTPTFVSEAEPPLEAADSESTSNCSRVVVHIGPLDGIGNKNKFENIGDPAANYFTSSSSEMEMENQLTAVVSDCNVTPCNLEKDHLASPKVTCDVQDLLMVESIKTDLDLTGDTEVASSIKGGNKALKNPLQSTNVETKLSPSTILNEGGAFLEEGKEFHSSEDNLWSSQKDGGDTKSPCHEYEVAESPNHIYPEQCSITPSRFMDPLCQQTDLSSPLPTASYEFERLEPLQPICQGSDMHPDASNIELLDPQPHLPILDISVPSDNDAKNGVEDMPPLPPLPPMQWRIGKLRHDSPASRGEGTLPSFNTLSPILSEEAGCIAQQNFSAFYGESTQPMNSFLQPPTTDANNPQRVIQMSGKEVVQTSLSPSFSVVPAIECQNVPADHLYLRTSTGPSNLLSHLTDKDLQHDTSNSGEELLQHTSSNLIRPSSATEDTKSQCVSLTSQDTLDQSLDSLTLRQHREDEQMYHTSLELEPTTENDKLGHESQTLEGELKWQSNSSAFVSIADYGKPVGSLRSRLLRPRDPLIEAVASHDKSNLRKVTERIIPKIEPEVDERNSLLEQIRNKSFNLKPAVAMRPSIQGPKTNLKVVAILEKANAIRQALAGSDDEDDDEDSWSDS